MLLGDFNARVDADYLAWPDAISHFGVGKTNEEATSAGDMDASAVQALAPARLGFGQNLPHC